MEATGPGTMAWAMGARTTGHGSGAHTDRCRRPDKSYTRSGIVLLFRLILLLDGR